MMTSAFHRLATLPALLAASPALAAPVSMTVSGSTRAEVVTPMQVQPISELRFGTMLKPTTAGTLSVSETGAVTATGGVTGNIWTPEPAPGRGPAMFRIRGEGNRFFILQMPNFINISNGSASMRVDRFRANTSASGSTPFGPSGNYDLFVGGRLNVGANQQFGSYSGTFQVTVVYH